MGNILETLIDVLVLRSDIRCAEASSRNTLRPETIFTITEIMFSSLLPRPRNCSVETIKVIIPEPASASQAMMIPQEETSVVRLDREEPKTLTELHLDAKGLLDYGETIAAANGNASVQSTYEDTIPLKERYPNLKHHFPKYTLETCPDASLANCLQETKRTIEKLIAESEGHQDDSGEAVITTLQNGTSGDRDGRTIEIRTYQEDPMLPPKFKQRKNRTREPSPPPPVLKAAPTVKVTKELKDQWHIPAAVSNWKNNQGFAISLDKRVKSASGGSVAAGASINIENFTSLSLALESADREARESIAIRNEHRRQEALAQQQEKELQLNKLLEDTRNRNKSGKRPGDGHPGGNKRLRN